MKSIKVNARVIRVDSFGDSIPRRCVATFVVGDGGELTLKLPFDRADDLVEALVKGTWFVLTIEEGSV